MTGQRSSRDVRVGSLLVALAMLAISSTGCAGKVQDSEMRAVWVPRDASRGLVIDEEESNIHRIYRPATADDKGPRG